jgi:pyridoxamine 5'-phosphate oxidase
MDAEHTLEVADPVELFGLWLKQAEASEPNDANAAALATSTADGRPSVRMVLVKRADERGFCFFTNAESRKGMELQANPRAALCFHWKTLRRQVRLEGPVAELDAADVDVYFHTRSRDSQIGAAVSQQHPEEVPRPPYWRGFCVYAEQIEFWINGENRLHDRFLFTRVAGQWVRTRLYP